MPPYSAPSLALLLAVGGGGLACLTVQTAIAQLNQRPQNQTGAFYWFWLIVFLVCLRSPGATEEPPCGEGESVSPHRIRPIGTWVAVILVGITSLIASAVCSHRPFDSSTLSTFANVPPLVHDEYSYLLQARTYLAGRVWIPSHPRMPELFNAMHILNEGRVASRYFAGTGLWIAPFEALGWPELGHWLAGALACILAVLVGRDLDALSTGVIAGLLMACSPGLALFSNLLLSHGPTLVGLMAALWGAARYRGTRRTLDAGLFSTGIALALLCRPLTAIAWASALVAWLLISQGRNVSQRFARLPLQQVIAFAPIVAAILFQGWCNQQITGDWKTTPYQQYQQVYTPNHTYGFDNVVRGSRVDAPKRLDKYDRWARNLTPSLAIVQSGIRVWQCWRYTLSPFAIVVSTAVLIVLAVRGRLELVVLPALILAVHAIYFSYWFTGILGWHYVFETLPIWILIVAVTTSAMWRRCKGRRYLGILWGLLLVFTVGANWMQKSGTLADGLATFAFKARRYEAFQELVRQLVTRTPALVLVQPGHQDMFLEYVRNDPDLTNAILYGRAPKPLPLEQIRATWPERWIYYIDMDRLDGRLLSAVPSKD